jgi:hypothetical protein
MPSAPKYCLYLRTKTGYFRTVDGRRQIDPDSATACYACLKTQRPYGPDGEPADASSCGADRVCFEEER